MTLLRWRWRPQRLHHRALLDHMSQYVTRNLKNRSHTILRLWTDHCEYIAAQRCRRAQQMACLYTRLWEERALRELMRRIRKQVSGSPAGASGEILNQTKPTERIIDAVPNVIAEDLQDRGVCVRASVDDVAAHVWRACADACLFMQITGRAGRFFLFCCHKFGR